MMRIINTNYCYFSASERKEILDLAMKNLKDGDCKSILNSLYIIRRKNIIIRKLMEYLELNNEINIDGFVTFRMQDYLKDLEEIIEKAVDDYLMEREYREFIRLLKYFVEVQEPKLNLVHVVVNFDGKYSIIDDNHKEITNQCIQDFMTEVNEGEMNYDDLLVSSLITLAPQNLIIHGINKMKNKELLETIKSVFSGKVILCFDCELCSSNKVIHDKQK
jgi:putative sporulation protein YtxC